MVSRASPGHHVLRDLPRTYVVLVCAVFVASLLVLSLYYWSPIHRESAMRSQLSESKPQLNEFNIDQRYAGSIFTDLQRGNLCWELVLDNRNGNMWDKGYVNCDRVLSQPLEENQAPALDAWRLREVGKTFRHEGE